MTYSRAELVALCDRGLVPEDLWCNRDSAGAQRQLATARAFLLAGCAYRLATDPKQTPDTVWVEITYKGFDYFETHDETTDTFYIPTAARLDAHSGKDWY